uniref:Parathyroid hormone n=1 Tax=Dicentrarchus labrax TaxID=13489 RepID=A0A8C4HQW8_DICLA
VIKVNMRNLDYKTVFISLCILHLFFVCEGRPIRKRTVSEVQLMHNLGEHRQVQERREWLQMRLRGIHTARRLRPEELPDLSDLTPEEIQYALNLLEKLLKSKQS